MTSEEIFTMLNSEGSEELDVHQFMKNAVRLVESANDPFEWHALSLLHSNRIMKEIRHYVAHVTHEVRKLGGDLTPSACGDPAEAAEAQTAPPQASAGTATGACWPYGGGQTAHA